MVYIYNIAKSITTGYIFYLKDVIHSTFTYTAFVAHLENQENGVLYILNSQGKPWVKTYSKMAQGKTSYSQNIYDGVKSSRFLWSLANSS